MDLLPNTYREEAANLIAFDLVDFVGWNNSDMDVMRRYHSADVAVDIAGTHTDGMDAHVKMLLDMLGDGTAQRIIQHVPKVAEGRWTAVVGVTAIGSMATVAHWQNGVMTAEYLFLRPMTSAEIDEIDTSDTIMSIATPNSPELRAATGAEPGWTARMGKSYALFSRIVDGQAVERQGYAII